MENITEKDIKEFVKPAMKPKSKVKVEVEKADMGVSWKAKSLLAFLALGILFTGVAYAFEAYAGWRAVHQYQVPWVFEWRPLIVEVKPDIVSPTAKVEVLQEPLQVWTGTASYYSWNGCMGCDPNRIMANGEVLNDMNKTLAFNHLPMNTEVVVTNLSNGLKTTAKVTDTGGFDSLGRIADLSVATKEVLKCNDLCQIRIEVF